MSSTNTRTLAWRFLRTGYSLVAAILGISCLFPAFMYIVIWLADPNVIHHMRADMTVITVIFAVAVWLIFPILIVFACGYVRSLYVLPLSSRRIVNTQLACGVFAVAGLYLVTVLFYRVVFDAVLPFFGPLLVMGPMVVVAAGCAALLVDFRWWRPFVVMGLFVVAAWYMQYRVTQTEVVSSINWLTPTFPEVTCLLVIASIGYWLTLRGVTLDRCGELCPWPDFDVLWHRFSAKLSSVWRPSMAASPYRSAASAQVWFEFWQKGLIVPALAIVFGGISLIAGYHRPHDWLNGFLNGAITFLPTAMFVTGLIVGMLNLGGKDMMLSQYRSTRPLTDAQLAFSVIKACLMSGVVTVGIMATCAVVVYVWSWLSPVSSRGMPHSGISLNDQLTILTMILIASWIVMGLAASVMMSSRTWVIALPWLVLFAGCLSQPVLRYLIPEPDILNRLFRILLLVVLLLSVIGTIIAYTSVIRRRMVSRKTTAIVGMLAITVVAAVIANPGPKEMRIEQWAYLIGGAFLAAAPFATAPLAVAWNRHR